MRSPPEGGWDWSGGVRSDEDLTRPSGTLPKGEGLFCFQEYRSISYV